MPSKGMRDVATKTASGQSTKVSPTAGAKLVAGSAGRDLRSEGLPSEILYEKGRWNFSKAMDTANTFHLRGKEEKLL